MTVPRYVINFEELVNDSLLPDKDDGIESLYEGYEFRSKGITVRAYKDEGMLQLKTTNDIILLGFLYTKNRTEYFKDDHAIDKFDFYIKDNHIIEDMNIFETGYHEFSQPIELNRDTEMSFYYRLDNLSPNANFKRRLYIYMFYMEKINVGNLNIKHIEKFYDEEQGSVFERILYEEDFELEIGRYHFYGGDYTDMNLYPIDGIRKQYIDIYSQEKDKKGNIIPQEMIFYHANPLDIDKIKGR